MPAFLDLTGRKFGKLTVLSQAPHHGRRVAWWCECACGSGKIVSVQSDSLTGKGTSVTRSCGCLNLSSNPKKAAVNLKKRTHGHSIGQVMTPTYRSWSSMFTRCYNKKSKSYADYGGRGITICDRWQGPDGFKHFLMDMGERPAGLSLERKDVNGDYEPDNCRWATASDQLQNTRVTVLTMQIAQEIHGRYEHGESDTQIARRLKLDRRAVWKILKGKSWKNAVAGYPIGWVPPTTSKESVTKWQRA